MQRFGLVSVNNSFAIRGLAVVQGTCEVRKAYLDTRLAVHARAEPSAGPTEPFAIAQPSLSGAILRHMKVEEIAEAIAKLPPDQLARFRRWFTAFDAGRTNHTQELDSTATKLGRLAGRAFAELKRRAQE